MRKKNNEVEEDKKPPKPKKIFMLTYEFWDDGEVTCSRIEKVPQERGAPKNLPYFEENKLDYVTSVKTRLAKDKYEIFQEVIKGISITEEEIKHFYTPRQPKSKEIVEESEDSPEINKKDSKVEGFDFEEK
jgi:hypothetical protein